MELQVYTREGKKSGVMNVSDKSVGAGVRKKLLHQAVVMYEANKRVGTRHARGRGEKTGSKSKLFRQKGTGRARVGNIRTNKRVGGGVAFGIASRNYFYSINKKAKRAALKSALFGKLTDGEILVVDGLGMEKPKTREFKKILASIGIEANCLVVIENYDRNIYLSAHNIPGVSIMKRSDLNAYDVLRHRHLLVERAAADVLFGG